MKKIKELLKKILTKEVILYIAFGVLTTLVNLVSFYVMNSLLHWDENIANFIAILLAVIFAYITNKDLVFHANAKNLKERIQQFCKFMLGRAFTMVLEFVGGLLLFNLPIPNIIIKAGLTVIVIILNFFISKFFAFKNNTKEGLE
jgi:putative flippase GtrA